MHDIIDRDSLLALVDEPLENSIELPSDIENGNDFIAWCRRIETHPHTPKQIEEALEKVGHDENGCLKANLKTASRTFGKGTRVEEVRKWLKAAFRGE